MISPQLPHHPGVYRAVELYALLASTHVDWDIRDNDMPAFKAD